MKIRSLLFLAAAAFMVTLTSCDSLNGDDGRNCPHRGCHGSGSGSGSCSTAHHTNTTSTNTGT